MSNIRRKKTCFVLFLFFIVFFGLLFMYYRKTVVTYFNLKKEYNSITEKLKTETRKNNEKKALDEFLSTPEGQIYKAKLNGFVFPEENLVQISCIINEKPEKQLINFFGFKIKYACGNHTVNGKARYNPECLSCQRINEIYREKEDIQNKNRTSKEKKKIK